MENIETNLRKKMKNSPELLSDLILFRKRAIIESVIDKSIALSL